MSHHEYILEGNRLHPVSDVVLVLVMVVGPCCCYDGPSTYKEHYDLNNNEEHIPTTFLVLVGFFHDILFH